MYWAVEGAMGVLGKAISVYRTPAARRDLDSKMPKVNRSFNKVREELEEVGLLYEPDDEDDGGYLDQIELYVTYFASEGQTQGFVFDEKVSLLDYLKGYETGAIYLPADLINDDYLPGKTLTDVIRHEFAHAWYWLEPSFVNDAWFHKAFGESYDDMSQDAPLRLWEDKLNRSRKYQQQKKRCCNHKQLDALRARELNQEFVSKYAYSYFCEDFAETFMYYLRYRNSLDRFKNRKGVYRKLKAVEKAVRRARKELGL